MTTPLLKSVPKKRAYIAERELDAYLYLVNPDDLRVHRFESAGKVLWGLIDGKRSGEALAHEYCRTAGIPHSPRLEAGIGAFLAQVRAQDLIYTDEEPGLRKPRACKASGEGKNLSEPLDAETAGDDMDVVVDLWNRAARQKIILKTDLELTYACNHTCLHCYNPKDRQKTLSTQEFLDLIDELADQGCMFLGFTGGEVFVRPDAMKLAQRARERKFSIRFLSNGSLIDEELADQIADLHPESVEISLLGVRPETHDHFAQAPGSFVKILRALELLAEREVNVYARYVFTRHNVYEAPEVPNLAARLGVQYIYQTPHLLPTVDLDTSPATHRITNEQVKWLRQMKIWNPKGRTGCFAGVSRCSISPWGEIHPCEFLPQVVGNIREDKRISDIWHASEERAAWDDDRVHAPSSCRDCSNQNICIRCPAVSFLEEGSLTSSAAQGCQISGLIREAEAEMRAPGWTPPTYDDAWTRDLAFLRAEAPRGTGGGSSQLVTLRVPKK